MLTSKKQRQCYRSSVELTIHRPEGQRRALLRLRPLQGVTLAARRLRQPPKRPSHTTTPMEFPLPTTLEHREVGHGCHTVSSRDHPQGFSPSRRHSLSDTSGHFQAGNAPGIHTLQGFTPTARPADSSPTRYPLGVLPRRCSGGQTRTSPGCSASRHAHARSFQRLQGVTPAADPYPL